MKTSGIEYVEISSPRSGYRLLTAPPERIVDMLGSKRAIFLNPYGERDLRLEDLERAETLILGVLLIEHL